MGCTPSKQADGTSLQGRGQPPASDDSRSYCDDGDLTTDWVKIGNLIIREVKHKLEHMDNEEIITEGKKRMTSLLQVTDFSVPSREVLECFAFLVDLDACAASECTELPDYLAEKNFQTVFQKIWAEGFPHDLQGKAFNRIIMWLSVEVLLNATSNSANMREKCMDETVYEDILRYLSDPMFDPTDVENEGNMWVVEPLLGILYNVVEDNCDAREVYRENGAVETMTRLRNTKNPKVRMNAELLLACVINEDENELINSDDSSFSFLITALRDAMESGEKQCGFTPYGLIAALNKMAANDDNKVRIVKQGALPLYVKMLQPEYGWVEQVEAAKGLWILAFKCRDDILKEEGCIQALEHLVETSEDEDVTRQAEGALWTLKGGEKNAASTDSSVADCDDKSDEEGDHDNKTDAEGQHIMISYPWKYKPTMLRIRDQLRNAGFRVWMDVDHMSGNILDAMAHAVEKSAVVIICLSQNYKESPNCRAEAEYAYNQNKDIIPLRMEYGYKADGWLGIIAASRLYFNFCKEEKFDDSVTALIKELGERGRGNDKTEEINVAARTHAPPDMYTDKQPDISGWTTGDVAKWLKDIGLEKHKACFEEVDGSLLLEYRDILGLDKVLDKELVQMKFSVLEIAKFKRGLKKLLPATGQEI